MGPPPPALTESIDALLATNRSERPNDAQVLLERLRSVAAAAHVERPAVSAGGGKPSGGAHSRTPRAST